VRLIVAEDSALMREGLVRLLTDAGHEVPGAVADGDALLAAVREHRPDLVVVDVRMPPTHTDEGLRAALAIRREHPGTAVLVLSQYIERRLARELLDDGTGGLGYLLKDRVSDVADFLDAVARVAGGGTVLDPEVVRRVLARAGADTLTAREHDVLTAMAEGRTNAAIAGRLHVSASAVEKHVNAVFDKLGLAAGEGYNRRVLAILRHLDP
jgi:DNA-binding NarL/FixJ family response regulator